MVTEAREPSSLRHDRRIAAGLSILPGLGQLYNGQWRKALFFFIATLLCLGPAVLLITAGESFGHSLLDAQHFGLFLLVAFGSVLVFLLLLVMGLFLWASAAADARATAMALHEGRADDAAGTRFLRI